MRVEFYKIQCITNLYAGSGEINYNIIDNEVQRDPVTGYPIIHSSGVKGALRETMQKVLEPEKIDKIFGRLATGEGSFTGSHKFLDAEFIARPLRAIGSTNIASVLTCSEASVNNFLEKLSVFHKNTYGIDKIEASDFGENEFLINTDKRIIIEGEKTAKVSQTLSEQLSKLSDILGDTVAVAKNLDNYDLPVISRNRINNGKSKKLWYEEVVPHGSVFFFCIISEDDAETLQIPEIVQFGGNASIGCGFCKVTKISGGLHNE